MLTEQNAYCHIGERSSHIWYVRHDLLQYENLKNYGGSWTEYGSLTGVPRERQLPPMAHREGETHA